ncbi:MAG: ethanolamine utilization protein EutH [Anaerovoracaceae bacterium]|jgi:ethanolamine transporter
MDVNQVIVSVMAVFAVAGAVDRIIGYRFEIGRKFEEAFMTMGPLALSVTGILVLAPVISDVLGPVIAPLFEKIGADPSVFAGIFLGTDQGGAPLARELCVDKQAGQFSGLIISSMMGVTFVFTIPVGFELAGTHRSTLVRGILIGIITIPIGCLVGGLAAGFSLSMILHNLVPVLVITVLIAIGFWKIRERMVRGFLIFGRIIICLFTAGLALGIFQTLTGVTVVHGLGSLEDAFAVVANIIIVLAGALPLMHIVTRLLKRPLTSLQRKAGINQTSADGLVLTLANMVPMFNSFKDMDERGRVLNAAFAVSAGFVFGDYLGFTASWDMSMIVPMICGKLAGGFTAFVLALWVTRSGRAVKAAVPRDDESKTA